jgi:hypothetical protein
MKPRLQLQKTHFLVCIDRDVEACLIYMDAQGRKTTAITSVNNDIHSCSE